jgi:hypothetical protein
MFPTDISPSVVQRSQRLQHVQRRETRPPRVIRLRHRPVPECHDRVAHVLVQHAVVAVHHVGHRGQVLVQERNQLLRIELLGEGRKTADVREQDRHVALLTAEAQQLRPPHDLLHDGWRKIPPHRAAQEARMSLLKQDVVCSGPRVR